MIEYLVYTDVTVPASNGTDAHHCDTVSNRSSPSHFTTRVVFSGRN